jgi:hypothetical protein
MHDLLPLATAIGTALSDFATIDYFRGKGRSAATRREIFRPA